MAAGSRGTGNVVQLWLEYEHIGLMCCAFGMPRRRAEKVAKEAVEGYRQYVRTQAPVGVHLADQLILPMALAGGGEFLTLPLSRHSQTQVELIPHFLDVAVSIELQGDTVSVRLGPGADQ
jgi:RNA 3'-terminal phosphate cyclase (ATP)